MKYKKYYIKFYRDFDNCFYLAWSNTVEDCVALEKAGYEQITRKQAFNRCATEIWTRKVDPAFGGYGATHIYPASVALDDYYDPAYDCDSFTFDGYIAYLK